MLGNWANETARWANMHCCGGSAVRKAFFNFGSIRFGFSTKTAVFGSVRFPENNRGSVRFGSVFSDVS